MAVPIEAYTADGVLTGLVETPGRIRDVIETLDEIRISPLRAFGLDGRRSESAGGVFPADSLLLVVPDDADIPVHAVWHHVELEIGPYLVRGELPTLPGFDPDKALARPTGTYVLLREVEVRLIADPDRLLASHQRLLINRYDVESITSEIMLGFFFPGARLDLREVESEAAMLVVGAGAGASGSAEASTAAPASPAEGSGPAD
jgi:hypothetical protein